MSSHQLKIASPSQSLLGPMAQTSLSHYDVLGVAPLSSAEAIRAAYRKRAVQLHPDKGGDKDAFQQLQEAYKVLSDDTLRTAYDNELRPSDKRSASAVHVSLASLYKSSRHRVRYTVNIANSGTFTRVADVMVNQGTVPESVVWLHDSDAPAQRCAVKVHVRPDGVFRSIPHTRDVWRRQVITLNQALRRDPIFTDIPTGQRIAWKVDDPSTTRRLTIGQGSWWRLEAAGIPSKCGDASPAGDLFVHVSVVFPAVVPELAGDPPCHTQDNTIISYRTVPCHAPCFECTSESRQLPRIFEQVSNDCPVQ